MSTTACNTPSQPTGDTRSALDEQAWLAVCNTAATQARKGCGLSYDYYVDRLSVAIDMHIDQLPECQRAQALQIATEEWGYATPAERQETQTGMLNTAIARMESNWVIARSVAVRNREPAGPRHFVAAHTPGSSSRNIAPPFIPSGQHLPPGGAAPSSSRTSPCLRFHRPPRCIASTSAPT